MAKSAVTKSASNPGEATSDAGNVALASCLRLLEGELTRFVALRDAVESSTLLCGDDLDLLGSPELISEFVERAFDLAFGGSCHARVRSRRDDKVELTLWSLDGRERALFDLWAEVPQIVGAARGLRYEDVEQHCAHDGGLCRRLSPRLETAVYLHHLLAKRKDIGSERVTRRLEACAHRCQGAGEVEMARLALGIRDAGAVGEEAITIAQEALQAVAPALWRRRPLSLRAARLGRRIVSACIGPRRRTRVLALVGCDGVGKTSLGTELVRRSAGVDRLVKGKSLYRKSYVYKLAVIFIRPLVTRSRERFDERLAPAAYLRACVALRRRLHLWPSGVSVLDRSLLDFLYLDRKSDHPRFSRWVWLARWFGVRVPTVHLVVPHERLVERKQEMTLAGHRAYDRDMRRELSRRRPTDYAVFSNSHSLDEAASALVTVVDSVVGSDE